MECQKQQTQKLQSNNANFHSLFTFSGSAISMHCTFFFFLQGDEMISQAQMPSIE